MKKTARKVDEAVQRLINAKEKISFNSVSMEAGVSKAYLYTHEELKKLRGKLYELLV